MQLSTILWHLRRMRHEIWVRVVAYALLAIGAAVAARFAGRFVPEAWVRAVGVDSVGQILSILASSMLAVTTFSLSIAVSAFTAAASTATPRAIRLLQEDRTTQNVLATFLGAFLFSLIGVIGLRAGLYLGGGRLVLFGATLVVVALVVVALLRWISHLMDFGRMSDTLDRVENSAACALADRVAAPFLRGRPQREPVPAGADAVLADTVGYVQHVDMASLSDCADEVGGQIWLSTVPGSFVDLSRPLLWIEPAPGKEVPGDRLRAAFVIASDRSFEQDPRFGLIVLSEIASRALSPAVNDPGTAIQVIGRLVRILSGWTVIGAPDVAFPRVLVPPIAAADLLDDAFRPIARDGAGLIEVQIRLQKAFAALAATAPDLFGAPARAKAAEALERARAASPLRADLERLERLRPDAETAAAPSDDRAMTER